jgi:hypothetical protein
METRRIRRLKQRHLRRVVLVMTSIAALGLGVGLALPRSTVASALLLAVSGAILVTIGASADFVAPSHGINWVVRLSPVSAISTAFDSFRSRVLGTSRTVRERVSRRMVGSARDLDRGTGEFAGPVDLLTLPDAVIRVKAEPEAPNEPPMARPSPDRTEASLAGRR